MPWRSWPPLPTTSRPSQQELIEYYTALADALPLPLFLYNMPSHVKVFLEPATVKTLAEHPNIVGLKDSSANMTYFQTLLYHLGDREDFALYVGPEELTGESVVMGADGGVNGGANIFPELYVQMYYAACNRDVNTMRALQRKIMQISTSLYTVGKYGSSYLKGVKCSLADGHLRRLHVLPLPPFPHRGARPHPQGPRSAGNRLRRMTHDRTT